MRAKERGEVTEVRSEEKDARTERQADKSSAERRNERGEKWLQGRWEETWLRLVGERNNRRCCQESKWKFRNVQTGCDQLWETVHNALHTVSTMTHHYMSKKKFWLLCLYLNIKTMKGSKIHKTTSKKIAANWKTHKSQSEIKKQGSYLVLKLDSYNINLLQ